MCFDPSIGMSYDTFGNRLLLTVDDTGPSRCGNGGSTTPAPCTTRRGRGGGHEGRMGVIHRHHPLCTKGIVAKHPTRASTSATSHHGVHHGQGVVGTSTEHHRHTPHTTTHTSPKGIVSCPRRRRRRCGNKGSPKFLLKELFKDLKGVMKVVMLLIVLLVMVMLLLWLWLLGIVGWFVTRTAGGSGGFSLSFS